MYLLGENCYFVRQVCWGFLARLKTMYRKLIKKYNHLNCLFLSTPHIWEGILINSVSSCLYKQNKKRFSLLLLNPYWLLKLCRSPIFDMLNMHKEGRNEQPSDDNQSLIRRFIFASIPTQACKTHLWNEMIYYQSLGKCCPISRRSFGISGSPASQQRDTLVHTVLHFKLQNCLTAGTFQSFERETSKFPDLPGSHVTCTSSFLCICHKRWQFRWIGE